MKLSDIIAVNKRFARSANVERDTGSASVAGYIPTGRAVDVVERIARGMIDSSAGRAISITGPHGAGKSSLALFIAALLGPRESPEHKTAFSALVESAPAVADLLEEALGGLDPEGRGHLRILVTSEREPVTGTISRGIRRALDDPDGAGIAANTSGSGQRWFPPEPGSKDVLRVVRDLGRQSPLLLVIDEFGKNLESYVDTGNAGDPYLLQELAEATQGVDALPLIIITMQHLAFEDYVQDATVSQRREWAKIQGRFQDVPYLETEKQYQGLIRSTFSRTPSGLDAAIERWSESSEHVLAHAGLGDLVDPAGRSFPLHPLATKVLPDLCARYGQNERTLFSFLAGAEPLAVPRLLEGLEWTPGSELPFVGLDAVYDYFLGATGTSISASTGAGRWMEIESRIRDTAGLAPEQLQVLKIVGVLNLVGTAGTIRASAELIDLARTGEKQRDTSEILTDLENLGILTHREFADEYRIWEGSDFDLRTALEVARRSVASLPLAQLLNEAVPMQPVVASRHSYRTGILRVLQCRFADSVSDQVDVEPTWDGLILYLTDPDAVEQVDESILADGRAVVFCLPARTVDLREAATETLALSRVLDDAEDLGIDRVARRELAERLAGSIHPLRTAVARAWNSDTRRWIAHKQNLQLHGRMGASAATSEVCDSIYNRTPRVSNEMIARRELTSQGAKARRILMEALLANPGRPALGIEGYGPERAMYEAVFAEAGIHISNGKLMSLVLPPEEGGWRPLWEAMLEALASASQERTPLQTVADRLAAPPFGLKGGIIPLLLLVALVSQDEEVALYEHGSLVLKLDAAVAERMGRNLAPFSFKYLGVSTGGRREVLNALQDSLGLSPEGEERNFLYVVKALFNTVKRLPPYTLETEGALSEEGDRVREVFRNASEPDTMLFESLPGIWGIQPFDAAETNRSADARRYADRLRSTLKELDQAYPLLLRRVTAELAASCLVEGDVATVRARLGPDARELLPSVLDPGLRAFVGALAKESYADEAWLENVAMVVVGGLAPRFWTRTDVERYSIEVTGLGASYRRVRALLYDSKARNSEGDAGYVSRRVTITRPDGVEVSEVLSLEERDERLVLDTMSDALSELAGTLGSDRAARRALLAWLSVKESEQVPGSSAVNRQAPSAISGGTG